MTAVELWCWWGLSRRRLYDESARPARREILTMMLLAALLFNLGWLILLLLEPVRLLLRGLLDFWSMTLVVPLLVTCALLLLGLFLTASLLNATRLSLVIALARERGWLSQWDMLAAITSATALLLGAWRQADFAYWPASILVSALALLSAFGLQTFRPAPLRKRPWQITIPDWLTAIQELPVVGKEEEKWPEPEAGALPIYQFKPIGIPDAKSYPIGIRINEEVLYTLRRLNLDHGGRLYQEKPLAVVLSQGDPVNGAGAEEIDRFCLQIARIAKKTRLTRYQFASSLLHLVQVGIHYEFDNSSTKRFSEKPFEDYGRFPLETLHDQVGDCECSSLLCAALVARCGFPCALLSVEVTPGQWHYAVGLELTQDLFLSDLQFTDGIVPKDGKSYLYGETAADAQESLGFGVIPFEWRNTLIAHQVIPIPVAQAK